MPSIGLSVPSKNHYTFNGYYSGQDGSGVKYYNSDMSSANAWNITDNTTTLYAYFVPEQYSISWVIPSTTYDGRTMDDSLIQSDEELNLEHCVQVKGNYDGVFLLNEEELKIEFQGNLDGYKLIYQDKELNINSQFMGTYSKIYYNIHTIWRSWNNKNNHESEPDFSVSDVIGVVVYDNEIFIIIQLENVVMVIREYGNIPLHMYKFNIFNNELLYCGYIKKPTNERDYLRFKYIVKNK